MASEAAHSIPASSPTLEGHADWEPVSFQDLALTPLWQIQTDPTPSRVGESEGAVRVPVTRDGGRPETGQRQIALEYRMAGCRIPLGSCPRRP